MRIVVLHSDVAPDAAPDELDTLVTAVAVCAALRRGHHTVLPMAFAPDPQALRRDLGDADLVFNLVESVYGQDQLAVMAPALLEALGIAYTGSGAAAIGLTADKPATKRVLRAAGLRTPGWAEPPDWAAVAEGARYIVKSATADASIGLDSGCVVAGRAAIAARARASAARHGGRWFAERYVEGREFNLALLDEGGGPRVLPLAEMVFTDWDVRTPKIVGYAAKWDAADAGGAKMQRRFVTPAEEPVLARQLQDMALRAWDLFSLSGYARVDFRVDETGAPTVLEINANPCLEPEAGFAAAARQAGYGYDDLIAVIAKVAADG